MAILEGLYKAQDLIDGDTPRDPLAPERIRVTATPDEFTRIGPLPDTKDIFSSHTLGTGQRSVSMPADRDLVHHIARHVEVTVPDDKLIDWMKRGGDRL
jgi:hypothetical protein